MTLTLWLMFYFQLFVNSFHAFAVVLNECNLHEVLRLEL